MFTYIHCIYCHCVSPCLFTLHNQRVRTQRHCNYNHYYHKNNLCVYSHTRRIHLIESISFADDGFTFCHGGCCLISMLWKYGFIFWLFWAAYISSALSSLIFALSLSLSGYLTNITTTSREMMVIGHFGLGQLLTGKREWLQLGVLGSNLFNSFPPNNQHISSPTKHIWINECASRYKHILDTQTCEHFHCWFHLFLPYWKCEQRQTYVSHIGIKKPLILPLKAFKQRRRASLNNKWESSTWLVAFNLKQAIT